MQRMYRSTRKNRAILASVTAAALLLSGCDDTGSFNLGSAFTAQEDRATQTAGGSGQGTTTERDIEAPEIFSITEAGLWDGRPSLGGIWVAHPEVTSPERVRVTNKANGEEVVGALFKRERDNPGPRLQVSSDAAQALGILAGAPVELEVVALKKEVIEVEPEVIEAPAVDGPPEIEETTLDPIASAAAAIDAASVPTAAASSEVAVASTLPEVALSRPYLQTAVFNNAENAERAVELLIAQGLNATARDTSNSERVLWRVVVGPAQTPEERDAALAKVRAAGFADAYPVSN